MVRLRATRTVRVLTFEEKTRVANFFMLLIEVNLEKGVTRKRRSPQSTKNKKTQRVSQKKKHKPTSPRLRRPRSIKRNPADIYARKKSPARVIHQEPLSGTCFYNHLSVSLRCNIIFISGYYNDRHHHFIAC